MRDAGAGRDRRAWPRRSGTASELLGERIEELGAAGAARSARSAPTASGWTRPLEAIEARPELGDDARIRPDRDELARSSRRW